MADIPAPPQFSSTDASNIFIWILIAFPVYLLIRGSLATYLKLA